MINQDWLRVLALIMTFYCSSLAAETDSFPRVFDHEFGQTIVNAVPQRIVSLEPAQVTDSLIALGHPPVASTTYGLVDADEDRAWPPVIRQQAHKLQIQSIGTPDEPDLETIAGLKPDLIILFPGQGIHTYQRLSLIAPTLVLTWERDFRPSLRTIAHALGADKRAAALLNTLEQLQNDIDRKHRGTSIAIIRPRQHSAWLYGPESNAGRLLTEAGLRVTVPFENTSVTTDSPGAINDLSLERVPEIQADFLFFILYNLDEPIGSYLRHPVWQRNQAVSAGHSAGVQGVAWTNHGPLGALQMLREAKHALDMR